MYRAFETRGGERAKAVEARAARENETRKPPRKRVEQLQSELAASMFGGPTRARRAREAATRASGGSGADCARAETERRETEETRTTGNETRAPPGSRTTREGALAMVDDDQELRGRALAGRATDDGWQ